ncbi:MAG: hypothetical protein A2287_04920 [Candidatus Melainabacteria bacterium RIFOXYA12_FULL_32_12]|nr:MAG: hypothetical protein A2104_01305 [Candidatus Melainabacteria bacterium GWF2_32_7]OGI21976.1 MAG: hypothetical protein A2255_06960 [Candidatus Melainabacteria bacterium RIFOXYA2_FULL_32_9]OGI24815.1 MAG: hypothetical protein A2287_04920 [Candidatus Melainabacteria bacterium RIFOXYA12_FULL_32_12]
MSKSTKTLTLIVSLTVLLTLGANLTAFTSSKINSGKPANAERIKKLIHKNKGERGADFSGESTAGVAGGAKSGLKADDSEKFKKETKEVKNKLYKDSAEMATPETHR